MYLLEVCFLFGGGAPVRAVVVDQLVLMIQEQKDKHTSVKVVMHPAACGNCAQQRSLSQNNIEQNCSYLNFSGLVCSVLIHVIHT